MAYSSITKPTDYFNTVLWSGDSTASRNITGVGFQPDWVWQKCRSHAVPHLLYDSVRTAGNDKELVSNDANAEGASSAETDGYMSAFVSDGFTVAQGTSGTHYVNLSGRTYASWNWLADNTSGSSNTDGSITSTVSANTTSGFSIVTYTGTGANASVGHGLGVAPDCMIVKCRSNTGTGWWMYHKDLGATKAIYVHDSLASFTNTWLQDTAPTSSVFTLGTTSDTNGSGRTIVAYCFAEKKGYSKFGSYTGNGNANGTFVYTGFKPAWIMVRRTDVGNNWLIYDNKRNTYNIVGNILYPNLSNAESVETVNNIYDFTSNGFKARNNLAATNASGGTYIFIAFAENPFVGNDSGTGIPATAR